MFENKNEPVEKDVSEISDSGAALDRDAFEAEQFALRHELEAGPAGLDPSLLFGPSSKEAARPPLRVFNAVRELAIDLRAVLHEFINGTEEKKGEIGFLGRGSSESVPVKELIERFESGIEYLEKLYNADLGVNPESYLRRGFAHNLQTQSEMFLNDFREYVRNGNIPAGSIAGAREVAIKYKAQLANIVQGIDQTAMS